MAVYLIFPNISLFLWPLKTFHFSLGGSVSPICGHMNGIGLTLPFCRWAPWLSLNKSTFAIGRGGLRNRCVKQMRRSRNWRETLFQETNREEKKSFLSRRIYSEDSGSEALAVAWWQQPFSPLQWKHNECSWSHGSCRPGRSELGCRQG